MPRSRSRPFWYYVLLIILFLLLLKSFRVLPDPPTSEIAASIGSAVGIVGFLAWIFKKLFNFENRITILEERLKKIEADLAEIKAMVSRF